MEASDENATENMAEIDEQGKKDDTDARKRFMTMIDQNELKKNPLSAERNRDLIFSVFRLPREAEIKSNPAIFTKTYHGLQVYKDSVLEIPCALKGLYLIYECTDDGDEFPIYIGFTGVSYRRRFRTHMLEHAGVIKYFFEKKPKGTLKVDLVPTVYAMHAKLLESVFLMSFDFCLNRVENPLERGIMLYEKEKNDIHISRMYFECAYKLVLKEINDVNKHYLDNIGKIRYA